MSTDVNDFLKLTHLERIAKGKSGEKFKLLSPPNSCVVKFEYGSPKLSLIGTGVLQQAKVETTPGVKKVTTAQLMTLADSAFAHKKGGGGAACDEFLACCKNAKYAAVIMDFVQGPDFDKENILKDPQLFVQALQNPAFAELLGRIVAADAFALNSDRLIVTGPSKESSVAMNTGNLMIGPGGTAVPVDPSFMFPLEQFRPGSADNDQAWAKHGMVAFLRSPSVVTFCQLMQSSVPDEADAIFTFLTKQLSEEDQKKVVGSRNDFKKNFKVGAIDAVTSLLKRGAGWKQYILDCGGDKEDVNDFRVHKRFLNQIAQGETVADAGTRAETRSSTGNGS